MSKEVYMLPKTIILEGPDGAGKTTLMKQLSEISAFNCETVHHGPLPGEKKIAKFFADPILNSHPSSTLIMDRSWISEPIYAEAYGRENRMTLAEKRMLERIALAHQPVLILCLPKFEVCQKAFESRPEEEYLDSIEKLKIAYDHYDNLRWEGKATGLYDTCLTMLFYDWTKPKAFDSLVRSLATLNRVIQKNEGPGIGCWERKRSILIIGDTYNSKYKLPFIDIYEHEQKYSKFLTEHLEFVNLREDKFYFANVVDNETGSLIKDDFTHKLIPSKIIAIGETAAAWCCRNDLKFINVPRLQDCKVFSSDKPCKQLIRALNA